MYKEHYVAEEAIGLFKLFYFLPVFPYFFLFPRNAKIVARANFFQEWLNKINMGQWIWWWMRKVARARATALCAHIIFNMSKIILYVPKSRQTQHMQTYERIAHIIRNIWSTSIWYNYYKLPNKVSVLLLFFFFVHSSWFVQSNVYCNTDTYNIMPFRKVECTFDWTDETHIKSGPHSGFSLHIIGIYTKISLCLWVKSGEKEEQPIAQIIQHV